MTIEEHVSWLIRRYPALSPISGDLQHACTLLREGLADGGKILLCGNGGSASDCDHIVGELVKAFRIPRPLAKPIQTRLADIGGAQGQAIAEQVQGGLPALNLAAQSAIITAIANDIGAEMIFAQQVLAYGREGDMLIAISTSGNSANVASALIVAKSIGMSTLGLTGATGGKINPFCDVLLRVPATTTADIQALHLPVYHTLCSALEDAFFAQHE